MKLAIQLSSQVLCWGVVQGGGAMGAQKLDWRMIYWGSER
jgi:hypothetical protein